MKIEDRSTVVWNAHNLGPPAPQLVLSAESVKEDLKAASGDPTKHTMLIAGDWNFRTEGERGFDVSNVESACP